VEEKKERKKERKKRRGGDVSSTCSTISGRKLL
jgi:hypothetical protein